MPQSYGPYEVSEKTRIISPLYYCHRQENSRHAENLNFGFPNQSNKAILLVPRIFYAS